MALWERRPSVVSKAGLEGDEGARCIMLLFSVGLSCVKCCGVMVFFFVVVVFTPIGATQVK